jgi:hypothetical protein
MNRKQKIMKKYYRITKNLEIDINNSEFRYINDMNQFICKYLL